jgi:hypothetical protein
MDRITHQPPRQQGYGSTSSLRNDSLKHTRKHERRRKESNQRTKHSGSGGPSGQEGRTVRTGHADRPACCRGLSTHTPRIIRKSKQNLQRQPRITDRPRGARGLPARHPRTVRPLLQTVRNHFQPKIETKTDRKRSRARTRRTREEHYARGPSARPSRTIRQARTELKNCSTGSPKR